MTTRDAAGSTRGSPPVRGDDGTSSRPFAAALRQRLGSIAWIVPVLALGVTLFGWHVAKTDVEARQQRRLEAAADTMVERVMTKLHTYEQVLRSVRSHYIASETVTPTEWTRFVGSMQIDDPLTALRTVGLMERVDAADLARHHREHRATLEPDYHVWPIDGRATYFPITRIAPYGPATRRVLGFDQFTEPVRGRALEHADRTGSIAMSGVVPLVQDRQSGVVLFLPVRADGARDSRHSRAFVYCAIVLHDLLSRAGTALQGTAGVRIADESGVTIFRFAERAAGPLTTVRSIAYGGRTWQATFRSLPGIVEPGDDTAAREVLIGGGLVATLLAIAALVLQATLADANTRIERVRIAGDRRFREAADALPIAIWTADAALNFDFVNRQWLTFTGTHPADNRGRAWLDQVVPEDRDATLADIVRVAENPAPFRIGFRCVRADGKARTVLLHGEPRHDETGRLVGFAGTVMDVTPLSRARNALRRNRGALEMTVQSRTAELVAARDTAEAANRAKSEFLANMSQELRTRMHAIVSFTRIARGRLDASPPPVDALRHDLDRIDQSGSRLLALLDDLPDLARLEAGRMAYDIGTRNLPDVIATVVGELEVIGKDRGVRIVVNPRTHDTHAAFDSERIGQVVRNLLSNALTFTPSGHAVTITIDACDAQGADVPAGTTGPALRLVVSREGVGIPEDELESVFDTFIRSSRTTDGAGGTGLGLAIAREIVEQHGGSIRARNNPRGGADFVVVLPRIPPMASPHVTERSDDIA